MSASIDLYNTALDNVGAGNFPAALAAIESALMEDAADTQSWQLYIMILKSLGRTDDAEKATAKLKDLGLSEIDELLMQATEAASNGDTSKAITHYKAAMAIDPARSEIQATLALALLESGDPESALTEAEQAVAEDPENPLTHYALGRILRLSGEKTSALAALSRAVTLDPEFPMALYEQGILLVDQGQLTEALANFEKFLKYHPTDPSALTAVKSIKADLTRTTTF